LPVATVVFELGQFEVTADVPAGFVVLHDTLTLQLLAPAAMVHDDDDSVSVPVVAAWQVLPFQVVPVAQLDVTVRLASSRALLYRKKARLLYGTDTVSGPPEFPVATVVLALGQFDVTAEVPTGFVVLHDTLTLQLLAPAAMVHDDDDSVSVPVVAAWQLLPFQVVPDAQLDVAVRLASSRALLYRKKVRLLYGTDTVSGPPELPVATVVLALGQFDVTAEVPTGFDVLHDTLTLQLLAPAAMVHDDDDSVSVPVVGAAWQLLPFQVVPDAQLDVAVRRASSCWLLYRKKLRLLYGTDTVRGPPELPVATVVFALGQFDVTADVPTGFVVLHDTLTLQLLAPAAMVHDDDDSVSVPVAAAATVNALERADTPAFVRTYTCQLPAPSCTLTTLRLLPLTTVTPAAGCW
jgi:hypothetical protein